MVCQGFLSLIFSSSVQFSHSVLSDSLWPHEPQHTRPSCPSPTPRVSPTHVHWVGDAIQLSHPLSSPSPPSLSLSQHWVFSNESALCIRWPKHWSFSFNISPSSEHNTILIFLNLTRFDLGLKMWSILENVPCEFFGEKKCILLLLNRKLYT